jgi:hypothetical protein
MPIYARCLELLPPIRYSSRLLYNSPYIYYTGDVCRVSCLLICNKRACIFLILFFVLLSFLCLERGRSTQKLLADTNSNLTICCNR